MKPKQVLCGLFLGGLLQAFTVEGRTHITVILVGATGDLARKYLWQGLFQTYMEQVDSGRHSLCFYGGTRLHATEGSLAMFEILRGLSCLPRVPSVKCSMLKDQFIKLSRYQQLDTVEDFSNLNRKIEEQLAQEGLEEEGRLFYLSVPPFAYVNITAKVDATCRPKKSSSWLRVVLEKPFGHDLESAQQLAEELQKYLHEEEMYRIDHYLGKQPIADILSFRHDNQHFLDPIWNQHHIERVEIVMKETLDAKGRTGFYERYGVICDVVQNHLTEILTFVAMETPANISDSDEIHRNKMKVYSSLQKLSRRSAVIGQYQAYNGEVVQELKKPADYRSNVATFAGIGIFLDSPRWDGVPFILSAGKALDERVGYARILFKNTAFCLQSESTRRAEFSQCQPKQIIFYVGHGDLNFPAILVSRNLFKPVMSSANWKPMLDVPDLHVFGLPLSDYHVFTPVMQKEAYAVLILQVLRARRDSFVNTEDLLASWMFWTPLLKELSWESPRLYPGGLQNGHLLDFILAGQVVYFSTPDPATVISPGLEQQSTGTYKVLESSYREKKLVSAGTEEVIAELASHLQRTAEATVRRSGRFHLALSGGSSPLHLFQRLATFHHAFPWKQTHFWAVDERCVPLHDANSNFRSLHDHLLVHFKIPYLNIHPMPVHMNRRLCVEEDHGADLYANEIRTLVNDSSFDFVLLGVGTDGHTASLFSHSQALAQDSKLVMLSESPVKPHQRMTLSLSTINRAKKVAILITGKNKHPIVSKMSKMETNPEKWPVTSVQPSSGELVWYIDSDALFG
ncbi:GDH/6PGL endoplasmic bifunctional protein [Narcine bancroftii]|uniref:GDH/6PGL endoplasmic bifunctional protein n=1 Tax=Narcine bancroftii TaxID=1343680 RepID=UPI0038319FD7